MCPLSMCTCAGSFVLVRGDDFTVTNWCDERGQSAPFGYDFWYQPHFNTMISTEWGHPGLIRKGFNPQHVADGELLESCRPN